jgi:hydrogenase-4 component F
MQAAILLITPLLTALLCFMISRPRLQAVCNLCGGAAVFAQGVWLAKAIYTYGPHGWFNDVLYTDALSAFVLLIISILAFTVSWFSIGYMAREVAHGVTSVRDLRKYYGLLHIFIATMLASVLFNSLGIVWVAIEGTTLASALLVGFYRSEASLEAAWKYVVICTVGICFALFGTILIYYAATRVLGEGGSILYWSVLMQNAEKIDQGLIKLGFIFILVGYGTKVGFVPMHTWLPDAHSEAPTPVSALLSGGLLNCAFYAILRYHILATHSIGPEFSSKLFLLLGLLSVTIAVPFILAQAGLKRLLAYSSVEHMGIIAIGIGIGGHWGYYGAILHMFNHSLAKSAMFLLIGNVIQKYRTKKVDRIRGLLQLMPVTGTLLFIGVLVLAGVPPFAIFFSEFQIAVAFFEQFRYGVGSLYLVLLVLVFVGLLYYFSRMVFGEGPKKKSRGDFGPWSTMPALLMLLWLMVSGFVYPDFVHHMITQVVQVLGGV